MRKAKLSRFQESVGPLTEGILTGTILAIDPSSGSRDSQPGYAIFREGKLVDSGFIAVQPNWEPARRLRYLGKVLREEFETPDVLVTENIGVFTGATGGSAIGMTKALMSLQRAVGVVLASFDAPSIEVAPITWRTQIPALYKKTDEADAVMLAVTTIRAAQRLRGLPELEFDANLLAKLTTGSWAPAVEG